MKGDFTRDTFNPANHFLRVLTQQGRVQLDADANEQIAILLHYLQTLAADLIGPYGGPNGNVGFAIITRENQINDLQTTTEEKNRLKSRLNEQKLLIGPGHYYVDGVLCEQASYEGYATQPNYPLPEVEQFENLKPPYLLYLDVWERHLTHLDDPSIRDVALNGADTATRSQVVWHVRAWPPASEQFTDVTNALRADLTTNGVHTNWSEFQELWQPTNRGQLKAKALEASSLPTSPCNVPPNARYRGVENRLYRVEIHHGGGARDEQGNPVINTQTATFKWSRDNGSVVGMGRIESTGLHLSDRRDEARDVALNPWVELCNDAQELRGEPGEFVQRSDVPGDHPKVRCWDGRDGATPIQEGNWLDLEDGIQIQFQSAPSDQPNTYRTGDYWLIPARAATGDVEWPGPVGHPESLPPHGITHHYAPLASISELGVLLDLRRNFKHSSLD